MSTNWKSVVEKINAETFILPDGWDSRDSIAEELECSPEKVDDHLRPGLKSGRFIKQQHKVWDKNLKRNIMVIAYHDTAQDEDNTPESIGVTIAELKALQAEGKSYADIGASVGMTRDAVRARLRRA